MVTTETVGAGATYSFSLPTGAYTLVEHYVAPASFATWVSVTVAAGTTARVNIPNRCV
jgi:hypothetical protein